MNVEILSERLFESLINGDRESARNTIREAEKSGMTPDRVLSELFWPTYEMIDRLFRSDQLTTLAHHMGTRLLRVLVDQQAQKLQRKAPTGRNVLAFCGEKESDELGAQMAMDLLESAGYQVSFAGGGIAGDEILAAVQEQRPEALVMFASGPSDLPMIRQLIDTIREIGACASTQIVVGGGVFNRADGLAEEIGADLWASDPIELVNVMTENPTQRAAANQRTVGRKRQLKAA